MWLRFIAATSSRVPASDSRADRPGREQVVDRLSLRADHHALVPAGRKPLRPVDRAAGGKLAGIGNDDERRQVV